MTKRIGKYLSDNVAKSEALLIGDDKSKSFVQQIVSLLHKQSRLQRQLLLLLRSELYNAIVDMASVSAKGATIPWWECGQQNAAFFTLEETPAQYFETGDLSSPNGITCFVGISTARGRAWWCEICAAAKGGTYTLMTTRKQFTKSQELLCSEVEHGIFTKQPKIFFFWELNKWCNYDDIIELDKS